MIIEETVEEECSQLMKSNGRSVMGSPVAVHFNLCLFCIVANIMLCLYRARAPLFHIFLA